MRKSTSRSFPDRTAGSKPPLSRTSDSGSLKWSFLRELNDWTGAKAAPYKSRPPRSSPARNDRRRLLAHALELIDVGGAASPNPRQWVRLLGMHEPTLLRACRLRR